MIIGFQAQHTLGRRIQERQKYLRIFDRQVPLRADVEVLSGLSAHADAEDFRWWFDHLAQTGGVGHAFIVHGEERSSKAVAQMLENVSNEPAIVPEFGQSFEV